MNNLRKLKTKKKLNKMEFSNLPHEINLTSTPKKKRSKILQLDDYIPNHHNFLKEINVSNKESAEEILKDIESAILLEKETSSEKEIPFERFENIHRSKTEEFHNIIKQKFIKINNKKISQDFAIVRSRKKSSLSQNLSFRRVN